MSLYPDLSAIHAKSIRLDFHATNGIREIENFWQSRGAYPERVAVARYIKNGHPHTISVEWAPVHSLCANVFINVWPKRAPSDVFKGLKLSAHRLRAADFRSFLDLTRDLTLFRGIRARYTFPWKRPLRGFTDLPRPVRWLSIAFEVLDEEKKPVLKVTQRSVRGEWEITLEPASRFEVPGSADEFFTEPLKVASALAETVQ